MIVMIDNYDSFTYNLFQYFKQLDDDVWVYRNDEVTVEEIKQLNADLIVLSPGPGIPADSGICREVLEEFYQSTPILGICLGYQLIVEFFGGTIQKGDKPMHGKVTAITHDGRTVFNQLPASFLVTRYHSLQAGVEDVPQSLEISAMSEDGVVMAIRHQDYPVEGMQFHPESILTEYGLEMLDNFYQQACSFRKQEVKGLV